ncbi:PIN domain-containing protein [Peteryoungia desertarenae]|uniref:PIN domain-containing protein n=1 Tax=Peteryoungia desertarenae TaxID=1813451 RepID=A0ABX6QNG9_9HYPH|nr:PIN domain-containing protein [Peteryoungia desertarenae]QLF69817.1 PIN domain-containing protein [Peteryoungia desertarenae]
MIVVDANVILSALRSTRGASHFLLREMLAGDVEFAVSPAVALEYEAVLKRDGLLGPQSWIGQDEVDIVLDAVVKQAHLVSPWFRFRPFLEDPKDDLYMEYALAAGARLIVSLDRHFRIPAVEGFGLSVQSAGQFVAELMKGRSS